MKLNFFILSAILVLTTVVVSSKKLEKVANIVLTADEPWAETLATVTPATPEQEADIRVITALEEQMIDGFGACFNEKGWEALQTLDPADREKILCDLFDPSSGCKFNLCRMDEVNDLCCEELEGQEGITQFIMDGNGNK